jgi:histidine ammonia-lyase
VTEISGSNIKASMLVELARAPSPALKLSAIARSQMLTSRTYIEQRIRRGDLIYGVNTGFGAFSKVKISPADIVALQKNLVRSHAIGVGEAFSPEETRAIMILRANTLARGTSGVRPELCDKIFEFLAHDILPVIPSQGSVGASGDLAPLAHLALALIGEGEVIYGSTSGPGGTGASGDHREPVATSVALKNSGVTPLELQAKEGLALINGCQVMTAVGILAAVRAQGLLKLADVAGAMSLEALRGSRSAFDPVIFRHRPHPGQSETAQNVLTVLQTSEIEASHRDCDRVQDAYSIRCMPAVHGSAKWALREALATLEIEANSSTDNPLVFAEDEKILSCGNFHGQPVSLAMDLLAMALTSQASICERRIEKLINPALSDLPAFLIKSGGLNSGFMMAHVTAASLVSESKILSHPASVDTIPTSADKEDHVSMGTIAARKLKKIVDHLQSVLAIELLAAKQGLYLLEPLKPGPFLSEFTDHLNQLSPPVDVDRYMAPELKHLGQQLQSGELLKWVEQRLGGSLEC